MTYEMDVAGLKRELPLCKVSDDLYIGAFVMFGDVELTVHCAAELLKRAPEYDYLIAPEAKAIPLLYEMARINTSSPAKAPRPICPVCSRWTSSPSPR